MPVQIKVIGRMPTNHGVYNPSVAYGKKYRVSLYGCEWESKIDNNTYAPATLINGVMAIDSVHWSLISGIPENYGLNQEINDVENEIGTDSTTGTIKGRIKTLETNVGTGGSVDQRISLAKSEIIGDAATAYNTLGKIEDKLQDEETARANAVSAEAARAQAAESALQNLYNSLTQSDIVVGELPASGTNNKIYRVPGTTSYSDYMWDGSQFVLMATYNNAIDSDVTNGSENPVSGGAVAKSIFNKIPFVSEAGSVDYRDGSNLNNSASYRRTDYINISGISNLLYTRLWLTSSNYHGMAFYDADKVYISGQKHVANMATTGYNLTKIAVPTGAVYARFTYHANNKVGLFFLADYDKDSAAKKLYDSLIGDNVFKVWNEKPIQQYYVDGKHIENNEGSYSWDDSGACFMIPVNEGDIFRIKTISGNNQPWYYLATDDQSEVDIVGSEKSTSSTSWQTNTIPAGAHYLCITRKYRSGDGYYAFDIEFYDDIDTVNTVKNVSDYLYNNNINFFNATCNANNGTVSYATGALKRLVSNLILCSGRIKVSVAEGYCVRNLVYYNLDGTYNSGTSLYNNPKRKYNYAISKQLNSAMYIRVVINKEDDDEVINPNDPIDFKISNYSGVDEDSAKTYSLTSSYNTENTEAIRNKFSNLLRGKTTIETFLWFSDPHLGDHGRYELIGERERAKYISSLQKYYNSLPLDSCICCGDILTGEDSYEAACGTLAYTDAYMRKLFKNYIPVQGNHDSNPYDYGGDGNYHILTQQDVNNIMFRQNGRHYYSCDGLHTRFYVMYTGLSSDEAEASMTEDQWTQIDWFANSLLTDNPAHAIILVHIPGCLMTENIMTVATAYNNRQTITLNGITYNFASSTGKVEYCLAGHNHGDGVSGKYEIPLVIITNLQGGTYADPINRTGHYYALESSFDNCLCDYANNRMYMIRVGGGYNRTVNSTVNTVAVGSYISLTPSLEYTELIWQSGDSEVATVDAFGNITGVAAGITRIKATSENLEEEYWIVKVV